MSTPAQAPAPVPAPAAPRPNRARVVFPALIVLAVLAGGGWYFVNLGKERTDDAFVEGRVVTIAARVAGQVKRVAVNDNQEVEAGDVLVELDPADLEARRDAAQADLLSAQATLASGQAQLSLTETQRRGQPHPGAGRAGAGHLGRRRLAGAVGAGQGRPHLRRGPPHPGHQRAGARQGPLLPRLHLQGGGRLPPGHLRPGRRGAAAGARPGC